MQRTSEARRGSDFRIHTIFEALRSLNVAKLAIGVFGIGEMITNLTQPRRAMRISGGDPMIFVQRPISLGWLIAAAALCVLVALPAIRSKREEAFQE